jgi:hypothetical protein
MSKYFNLYGKVKDSPFKGRKEIQYAKVVSMLYNSKSEAIENKQDDFGYLGTYKLQNQNEKHKTLET